MSRFIIVFKNIRQVIKADEALRNHHLPSRIIPVPETISSECGMCIELNLDHESSIITILSQTNTDYQICNLI